MPTFGYPLSSDITQIAQEKMARLQKDRPIFDIMPTKNVDSNVLRWDQLGNFTGLQQARGLNGEFARVNRIAQKTFLMTPGVYGEHVTIDETELTERRKIGTFGTPIDISDLVMQNQDYLLSRELDRVEKICWDLLVNGTFSVIGPNNAVMAGDSYTTQTFSAGVTWSTLSTAVPLQNFRSVKLLHRGHSAVFGRKAKAYANSATINNMLQNANSNDLFGRRSRYGATLNNVGNYNEILMDNDLPMLVEYDETYQDDTDTPQLFIPNGKVVVVGDRPAGQTVGEYRFTRNANNPGMAPGPFMDVVDTIDQGLPPRNIKVFRGHNGGPVLYFPQAVVVMSV